MKRALIIAGLTAGVVWMYHKRGSAKATSENVRIDHGRLSAKRFNMINYRPKSNHENQLLD